MTTRDRVPDHLGASSLFISCGSAMIDANLQQMHEPSKVYAPSTPTEVPVSPSHIYSLSSSPGGGWDHSEGCAAFGGRFICQDLWVQDDACLHDNANIRFGTWGTEQPLLPMDTGYAKHDMHLPDTGRPAYSLDCNMWSTPYPYSQWPDASTMSQDFEDLMPQPAPIKACNLHERNSRQRQKRKHIDPSRGDRDYQEQRADIRPEAKPLKEVIQGVSEIFQRLSGGSSLDNLRSEHGKQMRTDWVRNQVLTLASKYQGFNVLVYKTGRFVEGPCGSVLAGKKRYLPEGSEECLQIAMVSCDDPLAAYKHVAPLVGCVTYHLAVFKSGTFQNLADEGDVDWSFAGNFRRSPEIDSLVEFF